MRKFNEDPDVVGGYNHEVEGDPYALTALKGSRKPTYGDDDSVTFALFNKFNLYSFDPLATHTDLYQNFTPYKNKQVYVQNSGELSEKDKNKINHVIDIEGTDRAAFLRQMPEVIQGRLWTDSRIISFWNDLSRISSRRNDIIDFIKMDIKRRPEKFQYEIRNVLYSYEDFLSGHYKDITPHVFPKFDPDAIHTTPPDKKGELLKSIGAIPKTPIPLADKQMIQGESFNSWLEELGYHATSKNWSGDFDKSKLSKYEPANLGFFLTSEKDRAKHFLQKSGGYIHKTDIDTNNIEEIDAKGGNLREFIPFIKKARKKGRAGVIVNNVMDGVLHQKLFVIFDGDIIKTIDIEPVHTKMIQGESFRSWLESNY